MATRRSLRMNGTWRAVSSGCWIKFSDNKSYFSRPFKHLNYLETKALNQMSVWFALFSNLNIKKIPPLDDWQSILKYKITMKNMKWELTEYTPPWEELAGDMQLDLDSILKTSWISSTVSLSWVSSSSLDSNLWILRSLAFLSRCIGMADDDDSKISKKKGIYY